MSFIHTCDCNIIIPQNSCFVKGEIERFWTFYLGFLLAATSAKLGGAGASWTLNAFYSEAVFRTVFVTSRFATPYLLVGINIPRLTILSRHLRPGSLKGKHKIYLLKTAQTLSF
jgi:hypothetical protein